MKERGIETFLGLEFGPWVGDLGVDGGRRVWVVGELVPLRRERGSVCDFCEREGQ